MKKIRIIDDTQVDKAYTDIHETLSTLSVSDAISLLEEIKWDILLDSKTRGEEDDEDE